MFLLTNNYGVNIGIIWLNILAHTFNVSVCKIYVCTFIDPDHDLKKEKDLPGDLDQGTGSSWKEESIAEKRRMMIDGKKRSQEVNNFFEEYFAYCFNLWP